MRDLRSQGACRSGVPLAPSEIICICDLGEPRRCFKDHLHTTPTFLLPTCLNTFRIMTHCIFKDPLVLKVRIQGWGSPSFYQVHGFLLSQLTRAANILRSSFVILEVEKETWYWAPLDNSSDTWNQIASQVEQQGRLLDQLRIQTR